MTEVIPLKLSSQCLELPIFPFYNLQSLVIKAQNFSAIKSSVLTLSRLARLIAEICALEHAREHRAGKFCW